MEYHDVLPNIYSYEDDDFGLDDWAHFLGTM